MTCFPILGIVPARSGSKGVPGKNLAPVAGLPLIAHTIRAALRSGVLDRVVVSTDSQDIVDVARDFGAEAPYLRPEELAADDSSSIDAVLHAVEWLADHEAYACSSVMLLQPTSPLRTAEDIQVAVRTAEDRGAEALVSVCVAEHHPFLTKTLTSDGRLLDLGYRPEAATRRQELPPAYALNGAIYLARRKPLERSRTFLLGRTYAYMMPAERSLDVDTAWDLHLADLILRDRDSR